MFCYCNRSKYQRDKNHKKLFNNTESLSDETYKIGGILRCIAAVQTLWGKKCVCVCVCVCMYIYIYIYIYIYLPEAIQELTTGTLQGSQSGIGKSEN